MIDDHFVVVVVVVVAQVVCRQRWHDLRLMNVMLLWRLLMLNGRINCDDVGDRGRRHAGASHEQRDHIADHFDAFDGLTMRHVVRVLRVDLENLIAHLQATVHSGHAVRRQLKHVQRYVELFAAADAETKSARLVLAQLDHVILVLVNERFRGLLRYRRNVVRRGLSLNLTAIVQTFNNLKNISIF